MSKSARLIEAQTFAKNLLDDPHYRETLKMRLMSGDLPPNLEAMLFHYAFGKPVETIAVEDNRELEKLSDTELIALEQTLRAQAAPTIN